ncbi:monocarboxylate transporter 9b [Sardina pilchardus]|uniref:monocarboxylate transporter 9b n=1 Tax=Sardina pilchardus TaxID=27697 RepID=UPI002E126D6D
MTLPSTKKALDGGWGWAVVVASFLALFLAYGSPQSVGVLYPEWLSTYQEGKGMTAWVGSLVSGVGLIASPICSACVVNFGARPVTIFSGVMVSGGLMLSAFAPNVQFLIFSYGIVVGIGCGLVYAATMTITCQYFDKRRGLALGIVSTGTSAGGFVYATGQNELIELFGLGGCLLIIGSLALNIIACAGPMRPLHVPTYYLKQKAAALQKAEGQLLEKVVISDLDPVKPVASDKKTSDDPPTAMVAAAGTEGVKEPPAADAPLALGRSFSICALLVEVIKTKHKSYSSYARSMAELFRDRVFGALCVAIFLFSLGAFPPLLFLEDVAQSGGLTDGVSLLLPLVSIVQVAGVLGKLGLGAMTDIRWMNSVHLYAFTAVGAGAALLAIPVTESYAGLQVISAAIGFMSGNWSITPYATTKVVGIDRLTEAHGILMFFGGFGIMLGPPVVGWFFDWMQSYDLAFYFSGGCVLLGGFLLFLVSSLPCRPRAKGDSHPADPEYTSDLVAAVA